MTKSENNENRYISSININGCLYKIKAEITEVYPTVCQKCGATFELHHGEGKCEYCGTNYTTLYKVVPT